MSDQNDKAPMAEQVVAQMMTLRDKRSQLKKKFEEEDARLRDLYARGENWLLKHMHDTGHKSFSVGFATVFQKTQKRYSFGDWPAFADFVRETGEVDLLQHRVSSTALDTYLKEKNELPPGVKSDPVVTVNIRKA